MIEPQTQMIQLSKVPQWVFEFSGFKPCRSTVFRWKTRGCRGKKLKTFRIGGRVCTTAEWLLEFFSDDETEVHPKPSKAALEAAAYLESQGFSSN